MIRSPLKTAQRMLEDFPNGLLFINKPKNLTSHDVVQRIRRIFSTKKVGHTGTLDPMATGMLPIVIGEATRFANYILSEKKCYRASIQLGSQTDTDDAMGTVIAQTNVKEFSEATLKEILKKFSGQIQQTVPRHCAIHQDGQRLYHLARKGIEFTPPSREVEVSNIQWINYDHERKILHLEFTVSSGTYIRSLARDIGETLGCHGHLCGLERLWVQPYDQYPMVALHDNSTLEDLIPAWVSINDMLPNISTLDLTYEQASELSHGRPVPLPTPLQEQQVCVRFAGKLLGICNIIENSLIVKRLRSFPLSWTQTQHQKEN